jgi:outer membrane protein assembly factor BamB
MPQPAGRRRWPWWRVVLAVVVVLIAGAGVAAWRLLREPGDVSHPNLPGFTVPTTVSKPPPKPARDDKFTWPVYGYDAARTRYLNAPSWLKPPFKRGWTVPGSVLLEFPPAVDSLSLYELKNNGALYAISKKTGRVRWRRMLGRLAASSPAVGHGVVYADLLLRKAGGQRGRIVALREKDGKILWSRTLPSRAESSPLLRRKVVYFGSENGTVYALRAKNGSVLWTYHADAAVKGGPAFANGILYFGDYSGHMHAVRASNGHRVWRVGTSGARFGFGSGSFYATPAVAFGRVFAGNTDGRVYSFSAQNGKLAWAKRTGGYVYSSAAVNNVKGLGPTVYVGSYDGTFYALNARSGAVRWQHKAGGKISGSPVLIGDVVYYSYLGKGVGGNGGSAGLSARTGRRLFGIGRGAFNPVVSDNRSLFLVAYSSIYQLIPTDAPKSAFPAPHKAKRKRAAHKGKKRAAHKRKHAAHKTKRKRAAHKSKRHRHKRR